MQTTWQRENWWANVAIVAALLTAYSDGNTTQLIDLTEQHTHTHKHTIKYSPWNECFIKCSSRSCDDANAALHRLQKCSSNLWCKSLAVAIPSSANDAYDINLDWHFLQAFASDDDDNGIRHSAHVRSDSFVWIWNLREAKKVVLTSTKF